MVIALATMLEKQISSWMKDFQDKIKSNDFKKEEIITIPKVLSCEVYTPTDIKKVKNTDLSGNSSISTNDLFTHSQRSNSEIIINISNISNDYVKIKNNQLEHYKSLTLLEKIKEKYDELQKNEYAESCKIAAKIFSHLKDELQSVILELSDILGEFLFPINKFTRKKPSYNGSTIHIPSLIRFIISNYQYKRFMLQKIAGGKREYACCIIIDVSSSLSGHPYTCNFESALVLIESLISIGIENFSIITFGDSINLIKSESQPWDQYSIYELFIEIQKRNQYSTTGSKDASAICFATSLLSLSNSKGPKKIFMFSDGYGSEGSFALKTCLYQAQTLNIDVIAICVGLTETGLKDFYLNFIQSATPSVFPNAMRSWASNRIQSGSMIDLVVNLMDDSNISIEDVWKRHQPIFRELQENLQKERCTLVDVVSEDSRELTIDIAFAMDCTGSMGSWIEAAKNQTTTMITKLTDRIKSEHGFEAKFRLAFIAYRDHCDSNRLETIPFTYDVNSVIAHISKQRASGGGDYPEDIAGAMDVANNLDWKGSNRIFVLISDAPCHGTKYHDSTGDSLPNGDKYGLVPEDIARKLREKEVKFIGIKCESGLDKMYDIFRRSYDSGDYKLEVVDLGSKVELLTDTVSSSVMKGLMDLL